MSNRSSTVNFPLSAALDDYTLFHRAKGSDPKTIYVLSYAVRRLINLVGDIEVADVTTTQLRAAMVTIQETPTTTTGAPPKVQTVHSVFVKWRTFFRWCIEEGYITENPMRRLSPPRLDNNLLPALDERELAKLDGALQGKSLVALRNRALVYLMLDSAVRLEECVELRVSDVDLETGSVRVRKGKGRKERITRVGNATLRALGRYVRAARVTSEDFLWISEKGGRLTRWGVRDALTYIGKQAGIHLHAHKLRRTCALQMLRNGCDIYSLQAIMGHAELDTLRKYLAQTEADVRKAHERFGVIDSLKRER